MALEDELLPEILLGPMLRRAEAHNVFFQLITSKSLKVVVQCDGYEVVNQITEIPLGKYCFLY